MNPDLPTLPAGYRRHTRSSPLTAPWEPLFAREADDGAVHLAVEVREAHCNSRGTAHGGLISALADNAMGLSVGRRLLAAGGVAKAGLVTVSLSLDFLDAARQGECLEFLPTVLKLGGSLAFVECRVACGDRLVARGNATFRLLD